MAEGYTVEKERVTIEPGPPVIQRVYYWLDGKPERKVKSKRAPSRSKKPAPRRSTPKPEPEPEPEPKPEPTVDLLPDESVTAALQRRLLNGESLTGPQIAAEYNVSRSLMSQAVTILREAGYEVTNTAVPGRGPGTYSVTSFHKNKKRKRSSKSWVDEVPDDAPVSLLPPADGNSDEGTAYSLPPFGATGLEVALLARKKDGTVVLGLRNSHTEWMVPVAPGVT